MAKCVGVQIFAGASTRYLKKIFSILYEVEHGYSLLENMFLFQVRKAGKKLIANDAKDFKRNLHQQYCKGPMIIHMKQVEYCMSSRFNYWNLMTCLHNHNYVAEHLFLFINWMLCCCRRKGYFVQYCLKYFRNLERVEDMFLNQASAVSEANRSLVMNHIEEDLRVWKLIEAEITCLKGFLLQRQIPLEAPQQLKIGRYGHELFPAQKVLLWPWIVLPHTLQAKFHCSSQILQQSAQ